MQNEDWAPAACQTDTARSSYELWDCFAMPRLWLAVLKFADTALLCMCIFWRGLRDGLKINNMTSCIYQKPSRWRQRMSFASVVVKWTSSELEIGITWLFRDRSQACFCLAAARSAETAYSLIRYVNESLKKGFILKNCKTRPND